MTVIMYNFLRDYANMVSRRVQDLGLKVSTKALAPTASLSELLDNIAKKGLLYAVIITSQHEVHGSLTLTILYGRNPQGMLICCSLCATTCKVFFQFFWLSPFLVHL